jgi:serine/threonine protein kinase
MAEPFELPHTLGHYTLTRRLGAGGMGVVYVARDDRLGRAVAVKMIAGLSDDSAIKRFWREARTAASVSHPNVCQIFEVDESPLGVYLAMELLDGEALDTRLARGALPPIDAVRVATEMLLALSALHERGFVHRDIKPSNVFLTPHGAKLLDFGLAREITEATVPIGLPGAVDVTTPGTVIGTPRYMAPEQVRAGPPDGRTDVYAVGAVLFECSRADRRSRATTFSRSRTRSSTSARRPCKDRRRSSPSTAWFDARWPRSPTRASPLRRRCERS